MVSVDELLTRKVSYQENAWSLPSAELSVQEVIYDIKYCKHDAQISHLRNLISQGNREQYGVDKKRLPGITFSGTFRHRRQIEELKFYNDLLVIDLDHMSKDELLTASSVLRDDIHILACWTSPSEEGVKGLVPLSFSEELEQHDVVTKHRAAFAVLYSYFRDTYGLCLDQSGSDITRLCFFSSDPALHLRTNSVPFTVAEIPAAGGTPKPTTSKCRAVKAPNGSRAKKVHLMNRTEGKNRACDRAEMASIIKYLEKRHISITGNYDRWVRVALAIASTFTYDVGERYFLRLCRLDGVAHDEQGSIHLLKSCYYSSRDAITCGTIWYYAKETGYGEARCDRDQH
jgi:hypothetical protein